MNSGFALMTLGVVLAIGAAGCSDQMRDYCDKMVACEGGNDKDKDACKDTLRGQEDAADDYDCGDQFDAVLDCVVSNSTCQSGNYSSFNESTSTDACATQEAALTACVQNATGHKSSTSPAN
jgi:hypothetical protein